jgi:hypothetical protein
MSEPCKNVLLVVTADPRASGRAAEALRIAAGIGGWEKVSVKLCLCGEARRVLAETTDDLVNGEICEAYLPLLLEAEAKVHVLASESENWASHPNVTSVTVSQLAAMGREAASVLRF